MIKKIQQPISGIDQLHSHTQTTKDRRILTANHTGTIDHNLTGGMLQLEDGVAVVHPWIIKIHIHRPIGARACGNHELIGNQGFDGTIGLDHFHGMGIGKPALAVV